MTTSGTPAEQDHQGQPGCPGAAIDHDETGICNHPAPDGEHTTAEVARDFNQAAAYLAPDTCDPDTIPVIVLAGIRIGAYITDQGEFLLGAYYDEADPALWQGPDQAVPTEVRLDGQIVYASVPPAHTGPAARELEASTVTYQTPTGQVTRPLRAFRTGPFHITCIVTEQGPGMSVTNAAAELHTALRDRWTGSTIRQIEHYPADGVEPAHYDEAFTRPCGGWAWRRLNKSALAAEFGTRLPR
ncbi:hypothetical protein [Streptomyces sp. 7N604]|uniref:hypothetical protein n=1 Tax=Streptomyces sp. 7N604 TaxID=3457415 RepID=UPI003FD4C9EC